ncbi:MAG: prolyl oligopeptidase family serine peptidase [Flavobacteriales bacterium]|nr:prolyl oligopeptidase family serine peptidase [Flavobacteriales bacterium]
MNYIKHLICFLFLLSVFNFKSQTNTSSLLLKDIMKGKHFVGHWPTNHKWLPSGELIFKWNPNNINVSEYYYIQNNQPLKLPDEKLVYVPEGKLINHQNDNFYVYQKDGRILKWILGADNPDVLYESFERIHSLQLVTNPNRVYFTKNNSLCYLDSKPPYFKEFIRFEKKKVETKENKQDVFLKEQQKQLFDYYNYRENTNKRKKIIQEKQTSWMIKPIALQKGAFEGAFISPDESSLIYLVSDYSKKKRTQVENYVSKSGWATSISARPKVGITDDNHQLFVYNITLDTSIEVSIDKLSGVFNKPNFFRDYVDVDFLNRFESPKKVIYHEPVFNKNGNKAIIEIRSCDNKDRWITILDVNTGKLTEIDYQHDEAWIGGPGISGWNGAMGSLGWMNDDNSIWFQSEETGYSHLYMCTIKNLKKKALTKGNFEVRNVKLSNSGNLFYLTLNKSHPGNRNFYTYDWNKNQLNIILEGKGNYDVELSYDEEKMAYLYSSSNEPWELYVKNNKLNSAPIKLTSSQTKEFSSYNWKKPEIIQFNGQDNIGLNARLYKPAAEKKNGAGVIFVHGAGYLQNAHNWWSLYFREYMFHHILTENGYTVLDIDYRASEGYGRDFRTAIYRHMGGWDLNDQLSGRDYLINNLNIDSTKIGIYGGSYGGFITLMALLTKPGKFACGAALRSVTDWAHYNHGYTSNILNTPVLDSLAYQRSSPINFAEGLSDPLLMLHGVIDNNVQFQDVIRLSQRFIELEKDDWELAVFPVESHGFKEPSSWFDEYKRILKLFNDNLK